MIFSHNLCGCQKMVHILLVFSENNLCSIQSRAYTKAKTQFLTVFVYFLRKKFHLFGLWGSRPRHMCTEVRCALPVSSDLRRPRSSDIASGQLASPLASPWQAPFEILSQDGPEPSWLRDSDPWLRQHKQGCYNG